MDMSAWRGRGKRNNHWYLRLVHEKLQSSDLSMQYTSFPQKGVVFVTSVAVVMAVLAHVHRLLLRSLGYSNWVTFFYRLHAKFKCSLSLRGSITIATKR